MPIKISKIYASTYAIKYMHANICETNDNFSMIITGRKHQLSEATKFAKFQQKNIIYLFISRITLQSY